MKFLNLFCQGYAYALTTIEFCIILNIITKFNKIDYKRKKVLLLQIPLFILIIFELYFDNTIFNNFMMIIALSIVMALNFLIYSEYLWNHNS